MKTRRILSTILALTMLLTLFGGEFASAAGMKIVTAGEELAYDPLAETASVAYEQHDAGYAVSLDRAADSVTMHVTAVPGSRSADKARLYVRTGVALKAGVAYRVSFALSSEKQLADYTVNFDGDTAAAYGKLDKRSVDAGATDRVEYTLTPKAASGELVLRLLLGTTEVNTLRFSDLAVEEAPAEQSGANKLLVDKLNYAAPGAIRCAAEAGYSAEMDSTDTSATMTVTNVPKSGAEVWKLKLMVSTGLKPEPGKTYRFRATLNASDSGSYEACYNEGEVEKGYDVLYNQSLKSGSQTVERMIYVPTDKENPGELIVQFSLGKLSKGTKVTISKVTVEEASPAYTNALARDFALDKTGYFERKFFENKEVGTTDVTPKAFNWSTQRAVTKNGVRVESDSCLTTTADKAELTIGAHTDSPESYHAQINIFTRTALKVNTFYRATITIKSTKDNSDYNVHYGTAVNGWDNDKKYGELTKRALAANQPDTVEYLFYTNSVAADELVISAQVGNSGEGAVVTVSDLKIEEMPSTADGYHVWQFDHGSEATNHYKFFMNEWGVNKRPGGNSILTRGGAYASLEVPNKYTNDTDRFQYALSLKTPVDVTPGKYYRVSFDVSTTAGNDPFNVVYGKTGDYVGENANGWPDNDNYAPAEDTKMYGEISNLTLAAGEVKTIRHSFYVPRGEASNSQKLWVMLLLGNTQGTTTVRNLRVEYWEMELGDELANVTYPSGNTAFAADEKGTVGSFYIENYDTLSCVLSGNGTSSATVTCTGKHDHWSRKMTVSNICSGALNQNQTYLLSCSVVVENATMVAGDNSDNYNVMFGTASSGGDRDKFMGLYHTTDTSIPVARYIRPDSAGQTLNFYFEIGRLTPDNSKITISGISVKPVLVPDETAWDGTNVTPVGFRFDTKTAVTSFAADGYTATLTPHAGNASTGYAELNVTDIPAVAGDGHDESKVKIEINTGFTPVAGKDYRVSFDIQATAAQNSFFLVLYGYYGGGLTTEKIYGDKYELSVSTAKTTISHVISKNGGTEPLLVQIQLGNVRPAKKFTVSNLRIEEIIYGPVQTGGEAGITGTVTNDMQPGYTVPLTRAKDSATVAINATPASGMEAWKHKLFLDTGVNVSAGEAYRVVFDTLAENDMDFEVCYNRGSTEKGFAAIYGLHAAAGKTKTVEKMVFAEDSGKLIVQLSLGMVAAPNKVTVSNLRVDRAQYSYSGKSALPAEISYQAGDVSYWAHADYDARFTNTADAVTAHITPPAKSPEPWKVKLFLDTGVALQGGKYYKVTTDVSAKKSQNYEICYNNGGVEFGYDSMGGLKVTGGKTERIEKLISVPAGKKDTNNLMLQFNLGKTAIANEVTIGGVTVEEVTLAYADALGKDFSYQKSLSTWTDPKTSYKAAVDSTAEGATLHISDVPASGTGVWMVKLFVHTGAMLEAGKSYQVSADLLAAKAQDFETCFNNEETEKGFDAIYGQKLAAGVKTTVDKRISVPASMTDAGELVLQFSVGGAVANDITVSNVSVQELQYGGSGTSSVPDTVIDLSQSAQAAGTLDVSREKLTYHMTKIAAGAKDNAIKIAGAALRSNDLYTVAFTAKADKELTGTLALAPSGGKSAIISKPFTLTTTEQTYSFTTADALAEGGAYDVFWQFGSADNQKLGSADVELSGISVSVPTERLEVVRSVQKVTVNGKAVSPDIYNINGSNYFKLRDLAVLLNGTNGQFVVRYNPQTNGVSLTTDKAYTPIGGELTIGPDLAATCVRSPQDVAVNGKAVNLKVYNIGGSNFFRLRDLNELLGFGVDYEAKTNTVLIASPLTPERQEASYAYNVFFRPEIDGESQPYVGDTMPFYDNGTYYIYYLKEGGDSYNHSVYLTTTRDFVSYREYDDPVLSASRADVQDSWIGTGSVVKADKDYYFFYTGFNASGSQEYHEKIMVAKGSSPTSFTKVGGWSITPPAELNQKNDFRDPQAYYDPATGTISLTVTASKDGTARILKYTLGKDLSSVKYDGVIFTDPTGAFYNLECSDTFRLGNKWYLTYSGQEDTLWYASADSRFGPYSAPKRMDGTIFYAAKHVENGKNSYMVGWTRRSASASSTDEVSGWGGNLAVQQLRQNADGSLSMIPADSIASAFSKSVASSATSATLTAGSGYSYKKAFTSSESFKLTGEFTCAGTGSLGLAFDFDGTEDQYKLISVDPAEGKLKLLFNGGATQIAETQAKVAANQKHTFTYIQDGSVGIFYLDGQVALTVRLYGVTDKPIYLFAENNSVTFTSLRQFTR